MSWRDAPLYIESYDLSVWVLGRAAIAAKGDQWLARHTSAAATDLLTEVALALTFPASRALHLERVDHGIVRIRIGLRMAKESGWLTRRQLRHGERQLRSIGRMVGGWRKRVDRRTRKELAPSQGELSQLKTISEDGPPPAGV